MQTLNKPKGYLLCFYQPKTNGQFIQFEISISLKHVSFSIVAEKLKVLLGNAKMGVQAVDI